MRILLLLIVWFVYSTSLQAQIPLHEVAPEEDGFNALFANRAIPAVTGQLLHFSREDLKTLPVTYSLVTPFAEMQVKRTAVVGPDGKFSLQLDYPFPYQQIWLRIGEIFMTGIYVNKGLHIEVDVEKIKAAQNDDLNKESAIRYGGIDGPLNVYLNDYLLYRKDERSRLQDSISNLVHYSRIKVDSLLPRYNNLFDAVKQIEDGYIATHPSAYSWILANERQSQYYAEISVKYWYKYMPDSLWQKIRQHKSYLMSNYGSFFYTYMLTYLQKLPGTVGKINLEEIRLLPDLNISEKNIIDSLTISKTIHAYPYTSENSQKWTKLLKPRIDAIVTKRSLETLIRRLDSLFPVAKADFLKLRLNSDSDVNDRKQAIGRVLKDVHTPWCAAILASMYKKTAEEADEINAIMASSANDTSNTRLGKPLLHTPFGADMYKVYNTKAADFLARLKQSFPGKAILVDLWATWCGPCLAEMPYSKKLQQESKDLPVVFVYLCTLKGSDENKWKSKVIKLQQPGIHFFIDEALDAELSSYFSFNGYPGHALIDKTGTYRPGAISWTREIKNKEALASLIE